MKKFKYLTFLFITFLCFTNVSAADCKKYACATCEYELLTDGDTVTFTVGSSGSKPVSVSISNNHKASSYSIIVTNHEIPANQFVSDSKNTIVCPKQLNFTVGTSHAGVTTYNFFIDPNSKSKAIVKLSKEDNNNKTIDGKSPEESSSSTDTISCTYDSKLTTSRNQNEKGPDITIVSDGKNKIDYTFSKPGWKISDIDGAVKASDFKDAVSSRNCPTLYASCGASGNDKFCSVSTKNNDPFHDNPSEGEKDKDADETEKERQEASNAFKAVKPGIKLNIKIQGQGCGVFSEELIEWLQWVLDVVRVGGLILAVVLGITDYVKATFASKEDSMNQANKNFTTRLLCLGILFLIPTLVEFLLTLLNIGVTATDPTCGLK